MDAAAGAIYAVSGSGLPASLGSAATPVRARTIPELKAALAARKKSGPVGFVPTMGALHAGHVSLVERARAGCATVVVSIYVNPTQFGPTEDLSKYPRDLEGDIAKLAAAGCDVVFFPDDATMYPASEMTRVTVNGSITEGLCGASRPGHFTGVATVVLKLLNLVKPDRAYFGEKDAQQLRVIRRMAADLFLETEIVGCPIVREADGLAMSSRNVYLTAKERKIAPEIYRILCDAKSLIESGERDPDKVEEFMARRVAALRVAELDYASAVDGTTLAKPKKLAGDVLLLVAARFGRARLIDNMQVTVPEAKR
ncbi:pantoate--beta-alanine ligase [Candidatus Ozemobacteraceae bacterium]|nr:pantoate--beta-alanine ligase [Candidatus Ozemobacteraceae bacterium]